MSHSVTGAARAPDEGASVVESPRPLEANDVGAARALVHALLGATPYGDRVVELLDQAARRASPEARALVIECGGTIAGLAIFGLVAGARGAARLYTLVIDRRVSAEDIGARLTSAAASGAAAEGARLLLAEVPDDRALGPMPAVLRRHGFREEARVPDFFRDGVALTFLRRDLTA